MNLQKLIESLKEYDEVQLLELLEISAEDIVNRFEDKVKERRYYIEKELELQEPEIKELDFD